MKQETTAMDEARRPVALAPGEGRGYDMGRIQAVFKADGAETAGRYSISEWWLEPNTTGPGAHLRKRIPPPAGTPVSVADPLSDTRIAAEKFALRWAAKASATDLTNVHVDHPKIPLLLDIDLVHEMEHHLGGSLRGNNSLRRAARKTFWKMSHLPRLHQRHSRS
jgi:hypothetical protein